MLLAPKPLNPKLFLFSSQSFGTDELFIESKSLGRLFSRKDSEPQGQSSQLARQQSYQHQASGEKKKDVGQELTLKKKLEEWDKEIPSVSLFRVLALNAREWWLIVLGVLGSAINGSIFPLFAIIFGEILAVFSRPTGAEILDGIGVWAGLYVVLGFVSGVAIFFKVQMLVLMLVIVSIWFFFSSDVFFHHCWREAHLPSSLSPLPWFPPPRDWLA